MNRQKLILSALLLALFMGQANAQTLYWSDFPQWGHHQGECRWHGYPQPEIYSESDGLHLVSGVAIDIPGNRIYFADAFERRIIKGSLDGSGPLVTLYDTSDGVDLPAGIQLDAQNGKLYWLDQSVDGPPGFLFSGDVDGAAPPVKLFDGSDGLIETGRSRASTCPTAKSIGRIGGAARYAWATSTVPDRPSPSSTNSMAFKRLHTSRSILTAVRSTGATLGRNTSHAATSMAQATSLSCTGSTTAWKIHTASSYTRRRIACTGAASLAPEASMSEIWMEPVFLRCSLARPHSIIPHCSSRSTLRHRHRHPHCHPACPPQN